MKDTTENDRISAAIDEPCTPPVINNDIEIPTLDLEATPTSGSDANTFTHHIITDNQKLAQPNILSEINVQAKNNRNIDELDPTPSTSASASASASASETPTPTQTPTRTPTPTPPRTPTTASSPSASSSSLSNSTQPAHFTRGVDGADYVIHRTTPLALGIDDAKVTCVGSTTVFSNEFIVELKPSISMESASTISPRDSNATPKDKVKVKKMELKKCLKSLGYDSELGTAADQRIVSDSTATARSTNSSLASSRLIKKHNKKVTPSIVTPPKVSNLSTAPNTFRPLRRRYALDSNNSDNASFHCDQNAVSDQSNIFLYIDLHGHASKKGIFMYGNYLPNTAEAVECMLLPRLMSLNCLHFHFDACVFSERNMYHKYVQCQWKKHWLLRLYRSVFIIFHCSS